MATVWHTSDNKEAVRSRISLWQIVGKSPKLHVIAWSTENDNHRYKMMTLLRDSSHTSNKVHLEIHPYAERNQTRPKDVQITMRMHLFPY